MKRDSTEAPRQVGGVATAVFAAVVGLATGLAARAGVKGLAAAAEPLSGHWLDIAKADHLIILDLLERAQAAKPAARARRAMLFGRARDAFARHALWEEAIIYPALRFNDLAEAAAQLCGGHADIKAAVFDLERTPVDEETWRPQLGTLLRAFETQARREEETLFPELRRAIDADEDARLTALVNQLNRRFV